MFNSYKKAKKQKNTRKNMKKEIKQQGIDTKLFQLFLNSKDLTFADTTPELINEFKNREHMIYKLALPCRLTLPEMYSDVNNLAGFAVGVVTGTEHNLTTTSRRQLHVGARAVIVPNGVVFKGALNNTEDLRIKWEEISESKIQVENRMGVIGFIRAGSVKYPINFFANKDLAIMFFDYVKSKVKNTVVDDGWS